MSTKLDIGRYGEEEAKKFLKKTVIKLLRVISANHIKRSI